MSDRSPRKRLELLQRLLNQETTCNQESLREKLEEMGFQVTQSTISRDLRKLGAVRSSHPDGSTGYRLPTIVSRLADTESLADMIVSIEHNGSLIVIHTTIGSAQLVAARLDQTRPDGVLGTLAGDDTIFIAPRSTREGPLNSTLGNIRSALGME